MYLKKLEISGFKSFANKTVLEFPSGVTAIVGPNGSGKSNVADAAKWVLGEQSMKSLRGKKSEDVIFTGSDKKSKMSAAAVSLYLDNRDKKIPLDYQEVVLTRKLFRNGESEYLINKSRARLIDIVDLLARSGVSQRGYCVINQGMADSILVAAPAERMVIFEEATGVRKFQIKKQQTINKLELTKRNLQRVTDLLNEIQPRLNSLKRQASKAQKRGEVEGELTAEEERLFSNIWNELNQRNKKYKSEKEKLESAAGKLSSEIIEIKDKLSRSEDDSGNYQDKFNNLQTEVNSLQETINDFQRNLSIIEGRIQIEKEKKEKADSPEYTPINLGYVKEKISGIIALYDKFFGLIEKITDLKDIEIARREGMEVKKNVESLLREIEEGRVSQQDKGFAYDDSSLKGLESERAKILAEIQMRNINYEEAKKNVYKLNDEEQEKRKVFFQLEKELQAKQEELNGLKDGLNQMNVELAKFEVRKEDLINEIKGELDNADFLYKIQKGVFEYKPEADQFNQEESRSKIRKLRVQLEQIGGIDPLVVEEYEETRKRFEFLSTQSDDLAQASESLKKVIKELDEKIENIFKESFKNINIEFDRYFKIIFGGGRASLSIKYLDPRVEKSEEEIETEKNGGNELSKEDEDKKQRIAGIEISAAPPGKKISNLTMLSGGERALTSIAILFAIISNNPPPFLIVDEIDAALDESNSEKVARITREIASKTQFVIITHNREMMKQAGVLYGVTMRDDGVSKIISLKLEEAEK